MRARVATIGIALAWLFAVVVAYYLVHKPFSVANFLDVPAAFNGVLGSDAAQTLGALGNVLGAAATILVVVFLAGVVGHFLGARFGFENPLEALVMYTGIGLGALGLITLGLAALGIVNVWIYWILVVVTCAVLWKDVREVLQAWRTVALPRPTRGDTALAVFCLLAVGITFLFALTPPWGWDGLQYHLVIPKLVLQQGRIAPPPDNLSLNNPALVEMLFLLGMVLKGDGAAQGFHWVFLPLTLGAILAFAQKYFSWRVGWLAAALFCAVPTVVLLATWAYNDLALTFFTFTAFSFALRAKETGATRDFVLVGLLCGFAFGEKVTAFFVPVALSILLLFARPSSFRNVVLMLIVAGALAVPWWLRNLLFVGNPVYPFVFGGKYWDAFRNAWYTRFGTGLLQRPLELLAVPWTMTVNGTQSDLFQGTLGPLLLVLVPMNLIRTGNAPEPQRGVVRAMWFVSAVLYVVWLAGVAQSSLLWQSRLLLPAFPLFCLLAALGLEKLEVLTLPSFSIQRFASIVVSIVLVLTAVGYVLALLSDRAFGYFLGGVSRDEYLVGMLGPHYTMAEWVNENLPADARVLFLWEPRSFYFQRNVEADAILDRIAHLVFLNGDAKATAQQLRAQGFTHVLLYREGLDNLLQSGMDPITERDVNILKDLIGEDLTPIYGRQDLGLELRNGRLGLANASQEPYAVYMLKAQ